MFLKPQYQFGFRVLIIHSLWDRCKAGLGLVEKKWSTRRIPPVALWDGLFKGRLRNYNQTRRLHSHIKTIYNYPGRLIVISWNQARMLRQTLLLSPKGALGFLMATYGQAWSFASHLENSAFGSIAFPAPLLANHWQCFYK